VLIVASSSSLPRAGLAAALMLPILAIVTRLAMLAILGVFKSRAANLWTGIFCGASAGILAMSFIPAVLGVGDSSVISNLWFTLVPVAPGLAAAWAQQDASAPGEFTLPVAVRIAGALPALILVVAVTIVTVRDLPPAANQEPLDEIVVYSPAPAVRGPINITASPTVIPLRLAVPVQVSVSLVSHMETGGWLVRTSVTPTFSPGVTVPTAKATTFPSANLPAGSQNLTISSTSYGGTPLLGLVSLKVDSFFHVTAAPLGSVTLQFGPPAPEPAPRPVIPVTPPARGAKKK
jgi:hypothetical protein